MADVTGIVNRYKNLRSSIGKSAISAFYPNDFEYYLCAFELVEFKDTEIVPIEYFVFPIQPSSIQKTEPVRTNIKTSMSGITVLKNSSIIPKEITLKGNFGKNFKILTMQGVAFTADSLLKVGIREGGSPSFSTGVKTGYGATKILQKILQESNKLSSSGESRQLFFYNMALGENYLVTVSPSGAVYSQSQDTNMIWQYSVSMTILAPLADVINVKNPQSRSTNLLSRNAIQMSINSVAKGVSSIIVRNRRIINLLT